jgi:negative regulator of flagellin synthesis FlgM
MSSFEIGASRPVGAVQPNSVQPASQSPVAADAAPTPAPASDTPQVETSLTTSAGTIPVDQSRVAEIRQAVQNGTYPVVPAKISDAMIAAGVMLQKASK